MRLRAEFATRRADVSGWDEARLLELAVVLHRLEVAVVGLASEAQEAAHRGRLRREMRDAIRA
jgi:hypothetical protein